MKIVIFQYSGAFLVIIQPGMQDLSDIHMIRPVDEKNTIEYVSEYPTGLYYLVIRGNTNLADEYVSSLIYLEEGSRIKIDITITQFEKQRIQIQNFNLNISNNQENIG